MDKLRFPDQLLKQFQSRLPRGLVNKLGFLSPRAVRRVVVNFKQAAVEAGCFEVSESATRLTAVDIQKFETGEIDDAVLAGFLENFLKKNGVASADTVVNIMDPKAFYVRNMTMASVPAEEMRGAIRWQLKDEVPFDMEAAAVQWRVLSSLNDEDGTAKSELLVVVAHRPVIDRALARVAACQLNPVRVTHGFSNHENLLAGTAGNSSCAILEIGREEILFGFFKDQKLVFVRKFPFSGERLTRSLTETLVSDEGEFKLTYPQAQAVKSKIGIPLDESQVFEGGIPAKSLISLMRPILEVLVRELRFSLDYLTSNFDLSRQIGPAAPSERRAADRSPAILYLAGEESRLKNLDVYLQRALQIEMVFLSSLLPAGDADLAREREEAVLGLRSAVLATEASFDFLPQEFRKQKRQAIRVLSLRYVLLAFVGVFVLLSILSYSDTVKLDGKIRDIRQSSGTVDQITSLSQLIYVRESLVKRIRFNRVPAVGILKLIGTLIPNEVILGELIYDQAGHLVSLKGTINADQERAGEILTQFMQRLRASVYFREVQFVSAKSLGQVQSFELNCFLTSMREP